jgi:hypothetical protein
MGWDGVLVVLLHGMAWGDIFEWRAFSEAGIWFDLM